MSNYEFKVIEPIPKLEYEKYSYGWNQSIVNVINENIDRTLYVIYNNRSNPHILQISNEYKIGTRISLKTGYTNDFKQFSDTITKKIIVTLDIIRCHMRLRYVNQKMISYAYALIFPKQVLSLFDWIDESHISNTPKLQKSDNKQTMSAIKRSKTRSFIIEI
jgi:hypothetical protein